MRLVTIRPLEGDGADSHGRRVAVALANGRYLPLSMLAELAPDNLSDEIEHLDLATVIALDPGFGAIRDAVALVEAQADPADLEASSMDPATVRLAAPIPRPGKIIGVGYNYLDHIR